MAVERKVRINVTLKPGVWRKGKRLARDSRRSLSSQLEVMIEEAWSRVAEKQEAKAV